MRPVLITITLLGCGSPKDAEHPASGAAAATIRTAAERYATWGRVDDNPRQAPELCAAPMPRKDALRVSAATEGPHGTKLYYLYANDRDAYLKSTVAVGFQIVKESFAAVPGQNMMAGEQTDLFVMAKVGTPDSDAGWIYGTTTAKGQVTSAGRVAACIGCHEDAPRDRLFGIRSVE